MPNKRQPNIPAIYVGGFATLFLASSVYTARIDNTAVSLMFGVLAFNSLLLCVCVAGSLHPRDVAKFMSLAHQVAATIAHWLGRK